MLLFSDDESKKARSCDKTEQKQSRRARLEIYGDPLNQRGCMLFKPTMLMLVLSSYVPAIGMPSCPPSSWLRILAQVIIASQPMRKLPPSSSSPPGSVHAAGC